MLSRENVGLASTCNVIGQTLGYSLSYIIFMAFNSPSFSNLLWDLDNPQRTRNAEVNSVACVCVCVAGQSRPMRGWCRWGGSCECGGVCSCAWCRSFGINARTTLSTTLTAPMLTSASMATLTAAQTMVMMMATRQTRSPKHQGFGKRIEKCSRFD